jgi:hypothetical protein
VLPRQSHVKDAGGFPPVMEQINVPESNSITDTMLLVLIPCITGRFSGGSEIKNVSNIKLT